MTLLRELFGVEKPVIAMAHFSPLPGTPLYDEDRGIDGILEQVRSDVDKLLRGGVDAILYCNEGDRPYQLQANYEGIAAMTRVISETAPRDRPFGVDFMWDAEAAVAMAHATGAVFVREVMTGAYESDMGLWNPDAGSLLRYRRQIGAGGVRLFFNITPEFASPLGNRSVGSRAKSAVVSSLADAILVAGPMAGAEPDLSWLQEAKAAVEGAAPVLMNTGARLDNIERFLKTADGVIVGSSLKVDGYTWNPVEEARVHAFMQRVHGVRDQTTQLASVSEVVGN